MKLTESHTLEGTLVFNAKELYEVIAQAALTKMASAYPQFQASLDGEDVSVAVTFEDERAGSPSYKTGTKARVKITQNMMHRAAKVEG